jgi:dUTPase
MIGEFLLACDPELLYLYPKGVQTISSRGGRKDSGVDIVTPYTVTIEAGKSCAINLGVRAVCICSSEPTAYFLLARSSINKTPLMLQNSVGLIDQGYRGHLIAKVYNFSDAPYTIKSGCALFQVASANLLPSEFRCILAEDSMYFDEGSTVRGKGHFGSTGESGSAL